MFWKVSLWESPPLPPPLAHLWSRGMGEGGKRKEVPSLPSSSSVFPSLKLLQQVGDSPTRKGEAIRCTAPPPPFPCYMF